MKNNTLKYITLLIAISALFLQLKGQTISKEEIITQTFKEEGEIYFCFRQPEPDVVRQLSRAISVDKIEHPGTVYAYANRKGFSKFLEYNLEYKILPHPGDFQGRLNMKKQVDIRKVLDWDFYPTYDAYVDMMYQFQENYPDLCQVFSIGQSVQGRELLFARISDNIGLSENEPEFLYTGTIHGDETTGYILLLRLIDYLLSNYGSDSRITNLVNEMDIWINPLSNPDGTYAGGNDTVSGARRYNANWIDLNRNYPDPEDGPHPDGEEWQIETVHFMELAEANHFVSGANLHGGTEVCNYPWDTWSRLSADDDWWQYVCHEYADTAQLHSPPGYMDEYDDGITNGYQWYSISGGRQDYMNYFHQAREFTLEISDTKLLECELLPSLWEYNYRSLLNYMEQSIYGLRGTVKDSVSGWPVKAEVYVIMHEMDSSWVYSSLPSGNYHRLLFEGTYDVRFSAAGYDTKVFYDVAISNRQATLLDVKLVPNGVGGIGNPLISEAVNIFPNPLTGKKLRIETELKPEMITLSDLTGRELLNLNFDSALNEIEIPPVKNGIYFLKIKTEEGTGLKKLMIKR